MNNNSIIQPYLFFDGRCEEAIEFYKHALGAQQEMLMRYKESPEPPPPGSTPPPGDKVMHAQIRVGGTIVMLSDGHCAGKPEFKGFALSIIASTAADADRYFNALADGGQAQMPLTKTFFSERFGMVTDKFGVLWMVLARQG